jgi:hypothetical protein
MRYLLTSWIGKGLGAMTGIGSVSRFIPHLPVLLVILFTSDCKAFQGGDKNIIEKIVTVASNDAFPESSFLTTKPHQGAVALVKNGIACNILISESDYPGVLKVAGLLQKDLSYVSGGKAEMIMNHTQKSENLVIVGTVGKSELIDRLVKDRKIDVSPLKGKWEQFLIVSVKQPLEGVDNALVIIGSDKRGTIFGMFELSGKMGVSPWYWWADAPIKVRQNIFVKRGTSYTIGEPKVKYRGIFINDEAPALTNWAKEKFGGFNHHFYEKVFELILRNKANYLWPAMWRPSIFATDDPENLRLADEYGIVISTTHHEPMMRYHEEWSQYNGGAWNYQTNKEKLKEFWRSGIERMGDFESVVTVGMRGDGDEAMTKETAVDVMKNIIADQRQIISDVTKKPADQTQQVWAIYKEVQDYYDKGLRVDDDILVLFCDDNWGNIRIVPKKEDVDHKGGYGMYYHFDFVGGPVSYTWINVTQIERVWEQMNLAYEWGVKDLWIVNVGDIKPMELPISFFLNFAWNTDMSAAGIPPFYESWAEQQFGKKYAREIGNIIALYTKYSARRTPEMLKPDTYSLENYREADRIIDEYRQLLEAGRTIHEALPQSYKAAYYQLVLFPIEVSSNLNEMNVAVAKNKLYGFQSRASTNKYADQAKENFLKDAELTKNYHKTLAGGKWNHMMSQTHLGYTSWNSPPVNKMPEISYIQTPTSAALGYLLEHGTGRSRFNRGGLYSQSFPAFDPVNDQHYFIEIFNKGTELLTYSIKAKNDWVKLSSGNGTIQYDEKVIVSIDWTRAPKRQETGEIVIAGAGQEFTVKVPLRNDLLQATGFVESNGVVSIEAVNFTRKTESKNIHWTIIPNLGRTNSALTVEPADAERQLPGKTTPSLEYEFTIFDEHELTVEAYLSPTLNYKKNEGLKYAVAIDNEDPQIVNIHEGDSVPDWEYPDWWNNSVTDHIRKKQSSHKTVKAGKHTLKIWMVDPGVVFQKFVIDAGGLKPSYLGPPESKIIK